MSWRAGWSTSLRVAVNDYLRLPAAQSLQQRRIAPVLHDPRGERVTQVVKAEPLVGGNAGALQRLVPRRTVCGLERLLLVEEDVRLVPPHDAAPAEHGHRAIVKRDDERLVVLHDIPRFRKSSTSASTRAVNESSRGADATCSSDENLPV